MDCDDVTLLLAAGGAPTPSGSRAAEYHRHIAECDACRELTGDPDDRFGWVVRIPEDALDDPDLLVLPTVDPVVFTSERELARGGMGRITRARDRRLGRDVAIEEVLVPELRARFEREVAITAQLQHPAIVPVYEAGTWPGGSAFYTMRLVSGGTLAEAIARTRSLEQRLALLPHVNALTDALAYAHARRIVHRDHPGALAFLAEAYRRGDTSVALRHLLTVATRDRRCRDLGNAPDLEQPGLAGRGPAGEHRRDQGCPVQRQRPTRRDLERRWLGSAVGRGLRHQADGGERRRAGSNHTGTMSIWDVHLEQRSPREIAALAPPSLAAKLVDPLLAPGR